MATRLVAEGGSCLRDHWEGGEALAQIRSWEPDFVVLQAQSTFCRTYLVNGAFRVGGAGEYLSAARRFVEALRGHGATPVLFAHWKREEAPEWDQWAIDAAVARAAAGSEAIVAPVGDAFQIALRRDPTLELYQPDGSHPDPAVTTPVGSRSARRRSSACDPGHGEGRGDGPPEVLPR